MHLRSIIYFHSKCNIFTRNSYFCVPWWTIFILFYLWIMIHTSSLEILKYCIFVPDSLWLNLSSVKTCFPPVLYLVVFVCNKFDYQCTTLFQACKLFYRVYFMMKAQWMLVKCKIQFVSSPAIIPFVCLSFFISLKLLKNVNQTWHTASLGERLSSLFNQRSHNLTSK